MGKPKYIEEVVNEEQVSETPAVLVAPAEKPDQLSPNPANSGFTKQLFVDSLPETGEPNVIYVTPKQAAGGVVGYKNYKWDITSKKWERVLGSDPALKVLNGGQGVVDNEVNPPKKAPEKVFTGEVVFNQEPTIEGKKLHDWVDSEGGVTQEELNTALGNYYKKTETYSKTEVNDALALKQDKLDNTSAPTGVVVKLLGFDSQGHVVNDDVPEGIVVDDALDNESTNAVSNKAVSDVLAEAYDSTKTYNENDFVIYDGDYYKCKANSVTGAWDSSKWTAYAIGQELSELENKKANVDGNYPTMTVGVADQLSPYDEESGDDQDEPFSFQATGTGNGTQPDFATGAIALIKEKQGTPHPAAACPIRKRS